MIYEKFPEYFSNAAQVIETKKRCIEKADRVIAISNSTKSDILEYFNMPEDRVAVVYLAASHFFRPLPEPEKSRFRARFRLVKPFLLYVGYRGGHKNFQMLLKAYSLWKRKNDFDLICVGGASKWASDENELITRAILSDSVRLFPTAADEELRGFYSCAYAFVYPSLYEGFGIPPLEVMACGTPVIVANTSSIPEVVGDAGLYFEPSSKEELLAVLDRVTEDEGLQQELIKRGLERSKIFNWHETAIKTYNVYREVS
jgi:glycosyltransferase involved in cell wall biosynthesis